MALAIVPAYAQPPLPDLDPNGCSVVNPDNGLLAVVGVYYDPTDGILWLDTLGLDRISNTTGGTTIGGDDFPAISVLVRGPQPLHPIPPFTDGNFDPVNQILWSYQYTNGRAQLIGATTPTGQFIRPAINALFQYAPGFGASDFLGVEFSLNFGAGIPGNISFCNVTVLPEPAVITLIGASLLAAGLLRRAARKLQS